MRLLVALAALAVLPATAAAAGFPVVGMDTTKTGATAPGDPFRYIALPARGDTTVVKLRRDGGVPMRHRRLAGASVVAPVAMDASTTGLSADGTTLALIDPRRARPTRVTHIVLIDTLTLQPTRRLELLGDFTLDGISPDGRRLYVVQYHGENPLDYAVRAYDVASRRLLPKPLVDPRHPDEKMTGFPMTRATSPDGRWAYTLYGGGDENFVHALDLAGGRAFCVDLEGLTADDLGAMRLAARPGRIDLLNQAGDTVRRIDASTFKVTTPQQRAIAVPKDDGAPSDGFPWGLAAAVAAVGAGALVLLRRRYAAGTDSAASRSDSSSSPTVP
jgi:DNA-binding beta-propeller fold protein YncE